MAINVTVIPDSSDITVAVNAATTSTNLIEWAMAEAYQFTSAVPFGDGVIDTATVLWPDGSAGAWTTTTHNAAFGLCDAYTITHTVSGLTVTQAACTRDVTGNKTAEPALTIA